MARDKEWVRRTVGGTKSENIEDRAKVLDGYHTPKIAVDQLVKSVKLKQRIWECANGYNRISNRLERKHDREVFRSDVFKWSNKTQKIVDFTATKFKPFKGKPFDIVTNPPFVLAQQFVESGMALLPVGGKLCLLLRLQFLEGRKRKNMFRDFPPTEVIVFSGRLPRMHQFGFNLKKHRRAVEKAGKKYTEPSSSLAFAWFVFEKKANKKEQRGVVPIIKWV